MYHTWYVSRYVRYEDYQYHIYLHLLASLERKKPD